MLIGALLASASAVVAETPAFESCSLTWVDIDDGTDSKEITVTIAGSAPEFALVPDRSFLKDDYLGKFPAGTSSLVKTNHDNDWNYLSARSVAAEGTKGEWVVCGNTSIFGPDFPDPVVKSSRCSVIGDTLFVDGNQAARFETRTSGGEWSFLEDLDVRYIAERVPSLDLDRPRPSGSPGSPAAR